MKKIALYFLIILLSSSRSPAQPDSTQSQVVHESMGGASTPGKIDETVKAPAKASKKIVLRLSLDAGALYDNNIYTYCQEYIDAFEQGERVYRYPGVKSIGDAVFPLGTDLSLRVGRLTARASASGKLYASNPQMNRFDWSAELELHGRISVRATYQQTPYLPIRPCSIVPYIYEMMWYRMNKGSLRTQLNLRKISPFVEVAVGNEDYNHTFDYWDALFYEGRLGFVVEKPVSIEMSGRAGVSSAKPHTGHDPTNNYGGAKIEVHRRFGAWTPGISCSVKDEIYTTLDSIDLHKGRNDFRGNGKLYVEYQWHGLGATAFAGYEWRGTTSPISKVDTRKDYGEFSGGVGFSWELKKKF